MDKPTFVIDGNNFHDFDSLFDEVEKSLIPNVQWGRNLNALNDILRGDFGSLPRFFILVWKNINKSKRDFGYEATAVFWQEGIEEWKRQIGILQEEYTNTHNLDALKRKRLKNSLESSQEYLITLNENVRLAQQQQGQTMFDWVMEMIYGDDKDIEFRPE